MDHVQDNGSMRGNENYSHELGQQMNNYIVDPSLIDQNQWLLQQQQQPQYAEDIFNPQQAYQQHPQQHPQQHQHQLSHQHPQQIQQQQYIQPAQSPFNYGASQSPVYQNAQYPGVYGQEPLRSNSSLGQYGVQYGGYPTTSQSPIQQVPQQVHQQVPQQMPQQMTHQSHQQYAPNQGQYSYSPQPQVPTTISPHDLDRTIPYPAPSPSRNILTPQPVPSNSASQNFRQSWASEPEFQEQSLNVSTPTLAPQYHAAAEPQVQHIQSRPVVSHHAAISPMPALTPVAASQPEPNQPSPASQPMPNQPMPSQPIPSVSDAAQKYTSTQLRVTHPELLAETKDIPSRRFSKAPWAILGVGSIELDNKYASKALPVWQGRPNRSGKVLIPGLEHKLSAIPTSKPKKIRAPGTKKYASERRSNLLRKERPIPLSANIPAGAESSLRPPSLSPEDSSSEYTSSEDESDYSDEEEELGDMRTLDEIRPEPRPTDVAEAASWDSLGIMYSPPGRRATTEEKMRVAMEFHPFIMTLREELVRVTAELTKAEAEKRDADVKTLKVERSSKQQALVNALNIAITKGHQDLKDTLATHDKFVVGLTNILRNCIKADDYLGDLALAVFHLMSAFTKTSEAVLTRSKFDGIVKKFNKNRLESKNVDIDGKRRQEDIKRFVENIMKNTVEAQDRAIMAAAEDSIKRGEQKEASARAAERENKPTVPAGAQPGSSLKRPHEPDNASNSPNKKVASEGAKGLPVKPSGNKVPIKATGFFAKLGKQGPKAAPAPASIPAKPVVKKPAPSTGPSTLSMLLADISKPKELPKAPEAPKRPDETPEQKARRERKESRRHLRVHFREGDGLTEVRIFTHERSEDEGRQGEMLRDAHDDRSEGMMHKQRFQGVADVEDEESEAEVNNKPWPELSEVDFTNLGEGYYGKAFTSRGGPVEFETPQQRIQTKREDTELMVVYTDIKDIPHSPKEPPSEPTTTPDTAVPHLRQPTNFPKVQARLLDIRLHGADAAMSRLFRNEEEERLGIHKEMTLKRAAEVLDLKERPTVASMLNAIANSPRFPKKDQNQQPQKSLEQNIAALAELQAGTPISVVFPPTTTAQPPQDILSYPTPPGMDPTAWANLASVFASKAGLPFPALEAPDWMPAASKRVWYETLVKEVIAKQARDQAFLDRQIAETHARPQTATNEDLMSQLQKIIAPQGQGQQAQQQGGYQPAPAQDTVTERGGGEYDPSDLQNVLAGLGYGQKPQQQQQQLPWPSQPQGNTNYPAAQTQYQDQPAWLTALYATQQSAPPATSWNSSAPSQQQTSSAPSWQSSYGQDGGDNNNGGGGGGGKKNWDNNNNGGGGGAGSGKFSKNRLDPDYKRGTKPCRFWQEGKCAKGANCTFIHE